MRYGNSEVVKDVEGVVDDVVIRALAWSSAREAPEASDQPHQTGNESKFACGVENACYYMS